VTVTIQPIGGDATTVTVQDGAAIRDALGVSGLNWAGSSILLNGDPARGDEVLRDGDRISLIPPAKGAR